MTCNFNNLIETEALLKVTGSHVHYNSGNISELVQNRDVLSCYYISLMRSDIRPIE